MPVSQPTKQVMAGTHISVLLKCVCVCMREIVCVCDGLWVCVCVSWSTHSFQQLELACEQKHFYRTCSIGSANVRCIFRNFVYSMSRSEVFASTLLFFLFFYLPWYLTLLSSPLLSSPLLSSPLLSSPLLSSPLHDRDMGCRLPKLRKAEEKRSPGNIYSTLRRPQVETKVGVSYTYHFLDFLLGKEGMNTETIYIYCQWPLNVLQRILCIFLLHFLKFFSLSFPRDWSGPMKTMHFTPSLAYSAISKWLRKIYVLFPFIFKRGQLNV